MLGLYYLPLAYISADTGLTTEGACKGLQRLYEAGFCKYDAPSEWVFVIEMARFQVLKDGEPLDTKDKRVLGIRKDYATMPTNPFLFDFFDKYHHLFHLESPRGISPLHAPSKSLRSQEQEQEQEQKQEEKAKKPAASAAIDLPDWLPIESWLAFVEMRKKIKKPMTDRAMQLAIRKLDAMRIGGHDVAAILDNSVLNGWQDLWPPRAGDVSTPAGNVGSQALAPSVDPKRADAIRRTLAELDGGKC
jgi:hypothetical protein